MRADNRVPHARFPSKPRHARTDSAPVPAHHAQAAPLLEPALRVVPAATGFRTVTCWVEDRGRLPDPQNLTESLCDALVNLGLLLDDSADHHRVTTPYLTRAKARRTVIRVEDTAPHVPPPNPTEAGPCSSTE